MLRRLQHRRLTVGVAAASLALVAAGCGAGGGSGSDDGVVKIGIDYAYTGASGSLNSAQGRAAEMVAEAVNAAGGIKELDGAKIELVIKDSQSDAAIAGQNLRDLANEGVSAIIGPGPSIEILPNKAIIQSQKIPVFTSAGDPTTNDDNENGYIYRVGAILTGTADLVLTTIDELTAEGQIDELTKVGVIAMNVPPGTSMTETWQAGFEERGIDVTTVTYDPTTTKDFAPLVAKLRDGDVDLVTGYLYPNDTLGFVQAVADQAWRPSVGFMMGAEPLTQDSIRSSVGKFMENWTTTGAYASPVTTDTFSTEVQALAEDFDADAEGERTFRGSTASVGAAAMAVAINAIAAAGSTDPEKVAAAARSMDITDPKTLPYPWYPMLGGVTFNERQENTGILTPFVQIHDGEVFTVLPADIAEQPLTVPFK